MTIKCLAGLMMLAPLLLTVLIAALAGEVFQFGGQVIAIWSVMIVQIAVLQAVDALLYAHFYQGAKIAAPDIEVVGHAG